MTKRKERRVIYTAYSNHDYDSNYNEERLCVDRRTAQRQIISLALYKLHPQYGEIGASELTPEASARIANICELCRKRKYAQAYKLLCDLQISSYTFGIATTVLYTEDGCDADEADVIDAVFDEVDGADTTD